MKKFSFYIPLFVCVVILVFYAWSFPFSRIEEIQKYVQTSGGWAPFLYILFFACTPFFPVMSAAWAIVGGVLFGVWWGSFFIIWGALLSASIGFFLSRFFSQFVRNFFPLQTIKKMDTLIKKNSFFPILLLRLLPIFPFDIVSYAAGFSKVSYKTYMWASFLGIIPGIFFYAGLGQLLVSHSFAQLLFLLPCGILLMVFIFFYKQKLKKRLGVE